MWLEDKGNGSYAVKVSYTGQFSGVGQDVGTFDVPAIRDTTPQALGEIRQTLSAHDVRINNLQKQLEQTVANNATLMNDILSVRGQVGELQALVTSLQTTLNAIVTRP